MKTLITLAILYSSFTYADYGKPQLLARYSGVDSYNAPTGMYCFSSEPQPTKEGVFLGCQDSNGYLMMKWGTSYEIIARSENGIFSHPKEVEGVISWYEFSMAGVNNLFEYQHSLKTINLKNLGSAYAIIDSFTPIKNGSYIYRLQDDQVKNLNLWKNHSISTLSFGDLAYIFPPVSSYTGEVLAKIRRNSIDENSPDELMIWNGETRVLLKDRDADPSSKIISFRHQHALDDGAVALVITDAQGDAMVILKDGKMTEVARAGKDLTSFDFFSPKMRAGVLAFRGVDLKNRKAVYVYSESKLSVLLTQGDVIHTDKGLARIDYQNPEALFYGSPGISPEGNIFQQATLTDIDSPMTLLGIGLIKLNKE